MTRDDVLVIVQEAMEVHTKALHAPAQRDAIQKALDTLDAMRATKRNCETCAGPYDEERCIDCHDRGFSKWQPKTERRNCLGPQPVESKHRDGEPCLLPIFENDKAQAQGLRFYYTGKVEQPEGKWFVNNIGEIMFFSLGIKLLPNELREILRAEPLLNCLECGRYESSEGCNHDARTCTPVPKAKWTPKEGEWVMSADGQGAPFQWDNKCQGKNFIADVRPAVAADWVREIVGEKFIVVEYKSTNLIVFKPEKGDWMHLKPAVGIAIAEHLGIPIMPESEYRRLLVDGKCPWGER